MILEILTYPDPHLTTVCEPVTLFDKSLHELVDDLFQTMYRNDSIGLAAPQCGSMKRIFVMDVRDGKKPFNPMCFINPELLSMTGSAFDEEGCLSMPGVLLSIRRATYLHFGAYDLDGNRWAGSLSALEARVFQHELDHLNGILFTGRASEEELARAASETAIVGSR